MFSSTRKVIQSISKATNTTRKFYQTTFRYLVTAITVGLAIDLMRDVIGTADCEAVLPEFDIPLTNRNYTQAEFHALINNWPSAYVSEPTSLASFYYNEFNIYANVNKLLDASFIFIGVVTHNISLHDMQNKFINQLGKSGDHIYFSGVAGHFACHTFCLTKGVYPYYYPGPKRMFTCY